MVAEGRRRFSSVKARTTMLASVVVAGALAVGAVGLVWLLQDRLIATEASAASLRSRDVAALVAAGTLTDRLSYPGEEDGFTQVVAVDGSVVAATGNVEGEPAVGQTRTDEEGGDGGEVSSEVRSGLPIGDGGRFVVARRTVDGPSGRLTVYSGSSLESVDDTLRSVTLFLVTGVPLLTLVVALVTRRVINRSLAPVDSIRAEVTEISEGDLHKRVPEPRTGDEIDRLAQSMNSMLARLERSSDRQRALVADASHELRSPLTSARTSLEVSVVHPGDREELLEVIRGVLLDHDRLDALVEDLLTLASLDDPAASAPTEVVDVAGLVQADMQRRVDPSIAGETTEALVVGRPAQLARVVTNLVDNAVSHRRERVEVSVSVDGRSVVVRVDDDGPGIAVADRSRVFDRFVRLDVARTAERGTGLGLAIVADIVTAHGGVTTITDAPLGGARLEVRLPAAELE